jgi:hypothetical protein
MKLRHIMEAYNTSNVGRRVSFNNTLNQNDLTSRKKGLTELCNSRRVGETDS